MTDQKNSVYFVAIVATFITCLVTANIIAVKLVNIGGLTVPAGVIIFPISYIAGDVLTEVYGFRRARQVIWLGFACNLLAVIAIWVADIAWRCVLGRAGGLRAHSWLYPAATRRFFHCLPRRQLRKCGDPLANEGAHTWALALEPYNWLDDCR